ncbi:uncharacterized protein [Aristolochia californica]|uniref:uncharacterized protein n=1 Tax=Aristolochia californica TaxID=171875 RepID=UPI0035DD2AEE
MKSLMFPYSYHRTPYHQYNAAKYLQLPVQSQPTASISVANGDKVPSYREPISLLPLRHCDHRIRLKAGSEVVVVRPYRYPHLQKDEIERQCTLMLEQGLIRPGTSPFSSPVLLVKKHDHTWRFCVDYRELKTKTVKDKFPIPVVDELLDELHVAKNFTKLDLQSDYHQVRMYPPDIEKTAFRTHHDHFEFIVMPFGLSNAPSTFQALMNEVAYLGQVITTTGVTMDPEKIAAIHQWPPPRNIAALRGFLGLLIMIALMRANRKLYSGFARIFIGQVKSDISMDFIEGLPKAAGQSILFVVVVRFSRYAHFIPMAHPYTTATVAQAFFENFVRLHSIPESIVSDRDVDFTSNFWKDLFRLCGTKVKYSSAYHPQIYGQTEVVDITIEMYYSPKKWVQCIIGVEYCYNTSFHTALQETLFKILYGRDPPHLLSYAKGSTRVDAVDQV